MSHARGVASLAAFAAALAAAGALAQDGVPAQQGGAPAPPAPVSIASRCEPGTTLVYDVSVDARLTRRNVAPTPEDDLRSNFISLEQTHEVAYEKPPAPKPGEKRSPTTVLARVTVTRLVADANRGFSRVRYDSRVPGDASKQGSSLVAPFTSALDHPLELLVDPEQGTLARLGQDGAHDKVSRGARSIEDLVALSVTPLKPQTMAMSSTWTRTIKEPLGPGVTLVSVHDCVFSHPEIRLGHVCARIDYTAKRSIETDGKTTAVPTIDRSEAGGSLWFASDEGFVVAQETWDDLALTTTAGKFTYSEERRIESRLELASVRHAGAPGPQRGGK